jgi:hypothetical protein
VVDDFQHLIGCSTAYAFALPPSNATGRFLNAMPAAPNISTAPKPSAHPKRSDNARTPTATAITGLTNA